MCLREFANGHAVQNAFEAGDFLPRLTLYNLQDGAAVVKLVRRETDAAHLYFVEGLKLCEIAEVQDVPTGTAKTRLFHARRKLKAALGETDTPILKGVQP